MKKIQLSKGAFTLVDDSDYEFLSQWDWHLTSNGYAARSVRFTKNGQSQYGPQICVLMHRQILGVPDTALTDHADGNKLNNQKSNLRIASKAENEFNAAPRRTNTTGYKWVFRDSRGRKTFFVAMHAYGKRYYGGYFKTKEEAALSANKLALKLHGRFAKLNVI